MNWLQLFHFVSNFQNSFFVRFAMTLQFYWHITYKHVFKNKQQKKQKQKYEEIRYNFALHFFRPLRRTFAKFLRFLAQFVPIFGKKAKIKNSAVLCLVFCLFLFKLDEPIILFHHFRTTVLIEFLAPIPNFVRDFRWATVELPFAPRQTNTKVFCLGVKFIFQKFKLERLHFGKNNILNGIQSLW